MCMWKDRGKFKDYVMSFSYHARKKGKLECFNREVKTYREMDEDELDFEYIESKIELDHKKNSLTLFIIVIALAVMMNVWNKFFSFMQMVLQYAATSEDSSTEIIKISFIISVAITMIFTLAILFLLYDLSKDIMILQKKLMMIENIKNKRYLQTCSKPVNTRAEIGLSNDWTEGIRNEV